MKTISFLIIFLILAGSAAASGFYISNINQADEFLNMNIENRENDVSNARIKAVIPDLGIMFAARTADLREDDSQNILLPGENVPEGEHLVRISVRKGNERKIIYRYIEFQ